MAQMKANDEGMANRSVNVVILTRARTPALTQTALKAAEHRRTPNAFAQCAGTLLKSKELASYLASSRFTNHFSLITDHSGIRPPTFTAEDVGSAALWVSG
jgi:hypothetical protein